MGSFADPAGAAARLEAAGQPVQPGAVGDFRRRGKATFSGSVNAASDFCRFTLEGRNGQAARRTARTGSAALGPTLCVHHALPPGTAGNVAGFL